MLYDLAENKAVVDWLRGRNGFKIGLVMGLIILAIWLPTVFTQPRDKFSGDLFNVSMLLHIIVFSFILTGLVWGLLFKFAAGVSWALGVGLIMFAGVALVVGLDVGLGWGMDWGFGAKGFYHRVDVEPKGILGVLPGLIFGAAIGATTVFGSIGAAVVASMFLRRFAQAVMNPVAPSLVRRFPSSIRQLIDPTYDPEVSRH